LIRELEEQLNKFENKLKSKNLNSRVRKSIEEDCAHLQKEIQDRKRQKQIAASYS
tara:strand:+ start:249 stop:413 length:165 start_codon:yes stop_codon:yes gene_type:complete